MDLLWQAFAGLIVLAGPWKASIVFGERTRSFTRPQRYRTALYTVAISAVVGVFFIVLGDPLVEFFHITDAAFLIAAGLIMVVFSIRMVLSDGHAEPSNDHSDSSATPMSVATYPLSVPLVITPPTIAALVALGVLAHANDTNLTAVIGALALVMAFNLVTFLVEARFEDLISPVVFEVAGRLLGVLLVAFGVGIAIDGLRLISVVPH